MASLRNLVYWLDQAELLGLKTQVVAATRALVEEHQAVRHVARKGRTAKSPSSAKAKGRRAVLEVCTLLRQTFPEWEEDDILIQTTSVGGQDVHLSPRACRDFPFAIEVKNVESLNMWKTIEQAKRNAAKKHKGPIIFARRNMTDLHVVIDALMFLQLFALSRVKE